MADWQTGAERIKYQEDLMKKQKTDRAAYLDKSINIIPQQYTSFYKNLKDKTKLGMPLTPAEEKMQALIYAETFSKDPKQPEALRKLQLNTIADSKRFIELSDKGMYESLGTAKDASTPSESKETGYNLNGGSGGGGDVSTMPVGGVKGADGSVATPGGSQSLTSRSAAIKYDDFGRPIRNDYLSIADSEGNLLNQFNLSNRLGADVSVNKDGYNQIKANATAQGPTDWAKMQLADQSLKQANLINSSNKSNVSAQQQAMSQLASKGGISQGQRERLAMQGARQQTASNQGILNQGMQQQLQVGLQDQQRKDQFLNQLPQMDLANANFEQQQRQYRDAAQQYDLGNQLKDVAGFNAYRADAYGEAAKMWGADKSADAQAAAAGGGGKK